MATVFEVLYDVAIDLQVNPDFKHLTAHHHPNWQEAESRLQSSLMEIVMQGEDIRSSWGKLRIFCRNFVNPENHPAADLKLKKFLDFFETKYPTDEARIKFLPKEVSANLDLSSGKSLSRALEKLCSSDCLEPLGSITYLEWLDQRWFHWQPRGIEGIRYEELESDLNLLLEHPDTKVPGLTLGKAGSYFAWMGLSAFAPASPHVNAVVGWLTLGDEKLQSSSDLLRITKIEKPKIRGGRFAWLNDRGGLTPRILERLIHMISNDAFVLGSKTKSEMTQPRLGLMKDALVASDIISARYYWPILR